MALQRLFYAGDSFAADQTASIPLTEPTAQEVIGPTTLDPDIDLSFATGAVLVDCTPSHSRTSGGNLDYVKLNQSGSSANIRYLGFSTIRRHEGVSRGGFGSTRTPQSGQYDTDGALHQRQVIILTWDASDAKLAINGTIVETVAVSTGTYPSTNWVLAMGDTGFSAGSAIDIKTIAVYDNKFTDTELQDISADPDPEYYSGGATAAHRPLMMTGMG